ncbi:AsmA family protein [Piscirickettsia salmonis]|uniref:AsmA family protein n=1 Tax=Piscirickettsia salmonis TaxID=1238 RepID=UPI003751AC25
MLRFIKLFTGCLGLLLALFILFIIFINQLLPKDKIKALLSEQVLKQTGRNFTIQGQLDLSIIPWVGIEAHDITFSSPKNFNKPLTHIQSMKFKLNILPLFKKQIKVNTLTLNGADIYLAQKANGQNNWTFNALKQASSTQTKSKIALTATNQDNKPSQNLTNIITQHSHQHSIQSEKLDLPLFKADNIHIQDSRLSFITPHANYHLKHIDLKLSHASLQQTFPLALSFQLIAPQYTLQQTLNSQVRVKLPQGRINQAALTLSDLQINSKLKRPNQADLTFKLQGQTELNLAKDQLAIDLKQAELANANLTGALTIQSLTTILQGRSLNITGQLATNHFNLNSLLLTLGLAINPKLPLNNAQATLRFKPTNNSQTQTIQLAGQLNDSKFNGQIQLTDLTAPKLATTINIDQINVTPYINTYMLLPSNTTLQTKDIKVTANFELPNHWQQQGLITSLQGTLNATIQHTQLNGINLIQMTNSAGNAFNQVKSESTLQHAFKHVQTIAKASQGPHKQTNLSPTTLNITIKQGQAQFRYQSKALPNNQLDGQGHMNLQQPKDYFSRVLLYRYNLQQGADSVIGVRLPFFAKGTLSQGLISTGFDTRWFMQNEAPRLIKQELKKAIQQQIQQHLPNSRNKPLNNILEQFFN